MATARYMDAEGRTAATKERYLKAIDASLAAGEGFVQLAKRLGVSKPAVSQFFSKHGYADLKEKLAANKSNTTPLAERRRRIQALVDHDFDVPAAAKALAITKWTLYTWASRQTGGGVAFIRELADELED